jgi:hypothetical protein
MVKVEKLVRILLHPPSIGVLKSKASKFKASTSQASTIDASAVEASSFVAKWIKKLKTQLSAIYHQFKNWWFEWKLRRYTKL